MTKTAPCNRRVERPLLGKLLSVFLLEPLFELSDATAGIKDALFAGVERVADRADFNEYRSGFDC